MEKRKPYLAIAEWMPGIFNGPIGWVVKVYWPDNWCRVIGVGTDYPPSANEDLIVAIALGGAGLELDQSKVTAVQALEIAERKKLT
jgi:hypothetical protein